MENNLQEKIKLQQQIAVIENSAKTYLDKKALQRYGNLRIAHQERALQIAAVIVQAVHEGTIMQPLTDQEFKTILENLQQPKKEFKFTRK